MPKWVSKELFCWNDDAKTGYLYRTYANICPFPDREVSEPEFDKLVRTHDYLTNRLKSEKDTSIPAKKVPSGSGPLGSKTIKPAAYVPSSEAKGYQATLPPMETIKKVQIALVDLGHNAVPIDGILGTRTISAISSFQQAVGIENTGIPSEDLLEKIRTIQRYTAKTVATKFPSTISDSPLKSKPIPTVSHKGKRLALIVGNSSYRIGRLRNPENDASLMAVTLRKLNFEVYEKINVNQRQMKRAIMDFGHQLSLLGENSVGLFYYAGHGVQVKGHNFLIPIEAELDRAADVEIEGVNANWILTQMEDAKSAINLVILDACRNNPFTRSWRSVGRGLARMDAPRGTLIAYSTRPGNVANDGIDNNSPYTKALVSSMIKPGLTLSDVFIETRNAVLRATNGEQVPWEEGGLTSRFYFSSTPN